MKRVVKRKCGGGNPCPVCAIDDAYMHWRFRSHKYAAWGMAGNEASYYDLDPLVAYLQENHGESRMGIKRAGNAGGNAGTPAGVGQSDASTLWPLVWEYFTSVSYEDGSARQTSTLMLFAESGTVKVCLNDRDADQSLWAAGLTPEAALTSLEGMLGSGAADWRAKRKGGSGGRR